MTARTQVTQVRRGQTVEVAKGVKGHAITYSAERRRYECTCGAPLNGGPFGDGRRGARDVMHFHRLDLTGAGGGAVDAPSV